MGAMKASKPKAEEEEENVEDSTVLAGKTPMKKAMNAVKSAMKAAMKAAKPKLDALTSDIMGLPAVFLASVLAGSAITLAMVGIRSRSSTLKQPLLHAEV